MADLLVKLYNLQPPKRPPPEGITVRRAFAAEKRLVAQWVAKHFGERWASECEISFTRQPVACFVATNGLDVFGFASYGRRLRSIFIGMRSAPPRSQNPPLVFTKACSSRVDRESVAFGRPLCNVSAVHSQSDLLWGPCFLFKARWNRAHNPARAQRENIGQGCDRGVRGAAPGD